MLWGKTKEELPVHAAARTRFVKALEWVLKDFLDINIYKHGCGTALYYPARGGRTDAVRLLLKNKVRVLPSRPRHAPLNRAEDKLTCEIVKLLLEQRIATASRSNSPGRRDGQDVCSA